MGAPGNGQRAGKFDCTRSYGVESVACVCGEPRIGDRAYLGHIRLAVLPWSGHQDILAHIQFGAFIGAAQEFHDLPDIHLPFRFYRERKFVHVHAEACLKHYVGYGASEAGRDYVYTEISRPTLWNVYLFPYKMCLDAGAQSLMSSFNDISGIPGSANHYTLTEVLRDTWGFDGPVVSDWDAVKQLINQGYAANLREASSKALMAGVDMDMMSHGYEEYLEDLVESGEIPVSVVDEAVRRVLRIKFRLGLFDNPYIPEETPEKRFFLPEAMETASQLAAESMVLLKNNGVLPIRNASNIAVIGPLAKNSWDLMGNWKGHTEPEEMDVFLDGIRREFPSAEIKYELGCNVNGEGDFSAALALAERSDVVILCLGEKLNWSGENTSRSSIALPGGQEKLLEEIKATGKPVVVTLTNGRPLELNRIDALADAVLETWQPGVNGASALGGILSGRINPSGKLAITFPWSTGQIPIYYNRHKSARRGPS